MLDLLLTLGSWEVSLSIGRVRKDTEAPVSDTEAPVSDTGPSISGEGLGLFWAPECSEGPYE